MALKIRLRRQGRINRPFYRVVLTDGQNPRGGKYIEALGWYNPVESEDEKKLSLKGDRIQHWLEKGAVLTEKTEALVAQGAPEVIRFQREKEQARRAKSIAKRKARKKQSA